MGAFLDINEDYDPATEAFIARVVTATGAPPVEARRRLYDDLIVSLKAAGVWTLARHLSILAAANLPTALLDLTGNFNLSETTAGTFVADRGWTAPSGGALNTGFIPSVQIGTASDFSFGLSTRGTISPTGGTPAGVTDGTNYLQLIPLYDPDNQTVAAMNKTAGQTWRFGSAVASLVNPFTIAQGDFNNVDVYRNGAVLSRSGSAVGSEGKPTKSIYFGGYNNNGVAVAVSQQLMFTWIGKALTSTQHAALYTAIQTFLTGVGAV